MKTLIVGSGNQFSDDFINKHYSWADFVIAADGGFKTLNKANLAPDVLLGDFDSIAEDLLQKAKAMEGIEIVQFPSHKDYTDLELAINLAIERGTTKLVIIGASGTRLDHTTANIHLLYKLLEYNIEGYIEDEHNRIYMVDKELVIEKNSEYKVSILPLPPFVRGVSTTGLSYELNNADLSFGAGLGISNEFCDEKATISVREGLLIVFISKD